MDASSGPAYFDGDDHKAETRMCEPDPSATVSLETRFIDIGNQMEPSGVVIIGGGVSAEVAKVEIALPDGDLPMQEMPILEIKGEERRVTGHAIGREHFLDKKGRFDAVVRAFDAEGGLLAEIRLCDPLEKAPCRRD